MSIVERFKLKVARSQSVTLQPSRKRVRSAFQLIYFALFVWTVGELVLRAVTFDFGVNRQQLSPADDWFVSIVYWLFLASVSFHILRLYVTMEFLEEEEAFFNGFFDNMDWKILLPEFIFRFGVISVITLKFYYPDGFGDLFGFLTALYFSMSLWSLWMWLAGKKERSAVFLGPSLAGLVGSAAAWTALPTISREQANIPLVVFMLAAFLYLTYSLWTHFRESWRDYRDAYRAKLCFLSWNAGGRAERSPDVAPLE